MIRIATAIALVLSLLMCITLTRGPAHAAAAPSQPADERQQENTSDPASAEPPRRTAEPETLPPSSNGTRQRNGAEVFIPSEEISEDFAVSFPVDI